MPRVGKKHFAYTAKGKKQAAAHAKKTGEKVAAKPAATAAPMTNLGVLKQRAGKAY